MTKNSDETISKNLLNKYIKIEKKNFWKIIHKLYGNA